MSLTIRGARAVALAAVAATVSFGAQCQVSLAEKSSDKVFTIGNYPVEATAADAVTAKRSAISDGRNAAFRSLMKRIVPVASYGRIESLKALDAARFISGIAVKSERNSATRYIASLDFSFSPQAVRDELRRQSIPFVDKIAPTTTLVTIFAPPQPGAKGATRDMSATEGSALWRGVWSDLDIANTITPLKIADRTARLHPDAIRQLVAGDTSAQRILSSEYGSDRVLLAIAQPDPATRRLSVVVAGKDAVDSFVLRRKYRIDPEDFAYSLELAAVISLGIVEGRWKAINAPEAGQGPAGAVQQVQLWVEFQNLGQWNSRQQVLSEIPGVSGMETGGLSARGASVSLNYPGGGENLRAALAARGLSLQQSEGTWILR